MAGNLEIIISHNANTYISTHRVARLSTSDSKGQPNVIPICYGFDGQYIYTALDFKSKRVEFRKLKRVTNILSNPQVAVVVDDFSEDWNDLSYILIIGHAKILENGLKRDQEIHRLRLFERKELENILFKIGFTPKIVKGYGSFLFPLKSGYGGFVSEKIN